MLHLWTPLLSGERMRRHTCFLEISTGGEIDLLKSVSVTISCSDMTSITGVWTRGIPGTSETGGGFPLTLMGSSPGLMVR